MGYFGHLRYNCVTGANRPSVGGRQPIDAQGDAEEDRSDPDTPSRDPRICRNINRDSRRRSIQHPHQLRKDRSRGREQIISITAR